MVPGVISDRQGMEKTLQNCMERQTVMLWSVADVLFIAGEQAPPPVIQGLARAPAGGCATMCTSTSCPRMTWPRWCSWATYGKCPGCTVSKPTALRWAPSTGCQPPVGLSCFLLPCAYLPGGEMWASSLPFWGVEWQPCLPHRPDLGQAGREPELCPQAGRSKTGVGESSPLTENTVVLEGRVPSCEPLTQIFTFLDAYADSWWQDQCLLLLTSWARCDLQCHSMGSSLEHFCCIHTCAYICLQFYWPGR